MTHAGSYEANFDFRTARGITIGLWLHLPVMLATAFYFEMSLIEAAAYSVIIAAGPTLLRLTNARPLLQHISFGIATACMSGLLIHLELRLFQEALSGKKRG